MKIFGFLLSPKIIVQVLISTVLGGLIGFGIEIWRGNELAVLLCACGAGIAAMGRLQRQQLKDTKLTK